MREKIIQARDRQRHRLGSIGYEKNLTCQNARIQVKDIVSTCILSGEAQKLYLAGMSSYGLSARAGHSVLKVARTIVFIDDRSCIGVSEIEEAIKYRQFGDSDAVWPL
jgi:magnesium chelatase family protein